MPVETMPGPNGMEVFWVLDVYVLGGPPRPVIVTIRDKGPLIFLFYHYYRVGGPPNVSPFQYVASGCV